MPAALNLEGVRFGRLVALRRVGTDPRGNAMWRCICDCGTETSTQARNLGAGLTRSCGCLQREHISALGRIGHPNAGAGHSYPHLWQATVTYYGAHKRVRHARGRADEHTCPCGAPAEQWAYDHSDLDECHQTNTSEWSTSILAYSLDPGHYAALCKPCHRQIDAEHRIGVLACL